MSYSFGDEIKKFVDHVRSLDMTLPIVMFVIKASTENLEKNFEGYIGDNKIERVDESPNQTHYDVPREHMHDFSQLFNQLKNIKIANSVMPKSFIVSMVSQFDAYLGQLIRTMFYVKPDLLKAQEKNDRSDKNDKDKSLTYAQIMKFDSLEEIREFIIEKEIETVLRKSHCEQFEWLEKKLGIPLRKDLDSWSTFIEVTERRNLFVHCDGKISNQYLTICKEHNVQFDRPYKVGDSLFVTPEYFQNAYRCILEIGVKLAQVIWRKLLPNEIEYANLNLNDVGYQLIIREDYALAIKLFEFITTVLKRCGSEEWRLTFIINQAQAYKWSGQEKKCRDLIASVDWSAYGDRFKLASFVLNDEFEEAAMVLRKIGPNGEVSKVDYKDWPVFRRFRQTPEFFEAYKDVFNETFDSTNNIVRVNMSPDAFDDEAAAGSEEV